MLKECIAVVILLIVVLFLFSRVESTKRTSEHCHTITYTRTFDGKVDNCVVCGILSTEELENYVCIER